MAPEDPPEPGNVATGRRPRPDDAATAPHISPPRMLTPQPSARRDDPPLPSATALINEPSGNNKEKSMSTDSTNTETSAEQDSKKTSSRLPVIGAAVVAAMAMTALCAGLVSFTGLGAGGIAWLSTGGEVSVEPETEMMLKCDGSNPSFFYMGDVPGHRHHVVQLNVRTDDADWDDTPIEDFTVRPVIPGRNGDCYRAKMVAVEVAEGQTTKWEWQAVGKPIPFKVVDQVILQTRANGVPDDGGLIVTCHKELSGDCRIDPKPEDENTDDATDKVSFDQFNVQREGLATIVALQAARAELQNDDSMTPAERLEREREIARLKAKVEEIKTSHGV